MTFKRRVRTTVRHLAKPAISVVAFGVCLLVGEIVVRSLDSAPDVKMIQLDAKECVYKRSTNPVLGFELKANYVNESPDFIESYERTNSYGQRDKPRSLEKPTGVERILLLGDSVVEGYGLPEDQTISQQLEQLLAPSTEVLNFGVSAYCTRAEIELLEKKGLRFHPDVVVLFFVENDFDNFNREAFPLGGTIERPVLVNGLFKRSHLFRLACTEWNMFHYGIEVDPVAWNKQAIGDNNVVEGVERFAILARDHGFKPLIVVWPRFLNDEIIDVGFMKDEQGLLIIEHLAAMHKIPSVRFSKFFQQHRKQSSGPINPRLEYTLGDELHPSKRGSQIAADAMKQTLNDLRSDRLSIPAEAQRIQATNEEMIERARSLSKDRPNYSRVHNRLGANLLKQGKISEAIAKFEKAIEADPNNAGAHNNLGVAYEKQRLDNKAMDQFKRAIVLQPSFTHANFNLARAFLRNDNKKLAIAGLKKTIELDPNHVGALTLLGRELGIKRQLGEAVKHLKHALSIDPNHAEGHNNLGVVYATAGKLEEAIFHFREALRIDPANEKTMANLQTTQSMID
ncbi:tetratricopeptide repeat protein [Planctomycetota bacterium]